MPTSARVAKQWEYYFLSRSWHNFPSLYVLYIVMGAYKYLHCLPSPADANVTVSVASVCYKKRG